MSKFEIDLDQVAFDKHGQQIGVEVSEEMLDGIYGGAIGKEAGNGTCGNNCAGSNNQSCGNNC